MVGRRTVIASGIAALMGVGDAFAHPSYALFDLETEAIFTGTVVKFDFINPHCWLFITFADAAGNPSLRGFEMDGPPGLMQLGVTAGYFLPGEMVTVKANPLRDGRPAGLFRGVLKADGTSFGDVLGLERPVAE